MFSLIYSSMKTHKEGAQKMFKCRNESQREDLECREEILNPLINRNVKERNNFSQLHMKIITLVMVYFVSSLALLGRASFGVQKELKS
jgi:hypothetical protein